MMRRVAIAGGGMGGLAASLACTRAGWQASVYEKAREFTEVGAGIQLGPNTTRILIGWGLEPALVAIAARPQRLRVRSAYNGWELGRMDLGAAFSQRYGAPYLTVHRADLQGVLVQAARQVGADLQLASQITTVSSGPDVVRVRVADSHQVESEALLGADGLWSEVRSQVLRDGPPHPTGHLAYRTLALQSDLPAALRSDDVTVWLGPHLHVVAYPVKAGEQLNVVAVVQGAAKGAAQDWDQAGAVAELLAAMGPLCQPLQDLVRAMPSWRLWALQDRPPVQSANEMASGRVALLGDAAHPMRPYLAQGAGMAIEDASEVGQALATVADSSGDVVTALRGYALNRWERCAQVQARSQRNGRIFHATGLVRWGRDLSLRLFGERLLDQPWLYQR